MRLALLLLLTVGTAAAQTTNPYAYEPAVVGAPYSVVRHWEQHTVMPDGKNVESHSVLKMYRDSAGRTRTDMQIDDQYLIKTNVLDPVARVEYWWTNKSPYCTMMKLGDPTPAKPHNDIPEGDSRTRYTGTGAKRRKEIYTGTAPKIVNGLPTTGTHVDRYAPGSETIVSTYDGWWQKELGLALYIDTTDVVDGKASWRYAELKRVDPPADLFVAPPKGYTIRVYENPNEGKFE